jgi:hypothetical protein
MRALKIGQATAARKHEIGDPGAAAEIVARHRTAAALRQHERRHVTVYA